MNSLPETVTRQRSGCDLNPGPSAPKSSTLTTRLPSHPVNGRSFYNSCLRSSVNVNGLIQITVRSAGVV